MSDSSPSPVAPAREAIIDMLECCIGGAAWPDLTDTSLHYLIGLVRKDLAVERPKVSARGTEQVSEAEQQLRPVREHLLRLAEKVTKPTRYGFQTLRRDRDDGTIEYQIFADTKGNGTQIAYVQSTRHDAEFITACLAQAPLFAELLSIAALTAAHARGDAFQQELDAKPECLSRAEATELQGILRTLAPTGAALVNSARELVRRYELAQQHNTSAARDYHSLAVKLDTAEAERDALRAQVETLRDTNTRLNRRCQLAEAAANLKVEDWDKRSTGQGRAYVYDLSRREIADLRAQVERLTAQSSAAVPVETPQAQDVPPQHAIDVAIEQSMRSPCRSKRGSVIFDRYSGVCSYGFNDKPAGFTCDGSTACKATCRTEAVHAEQMALLGMGSTPTRGKDMLHVKTVNGSLVPSGGPSCVQCSKLGLAAGVRGIWLYHETGWRFYDAKEWHRLSLAASTAAPGQAPLPPTNEERDAAVTDVALWLIHARDWLSECDPYMIGDSRNAHGLISRAVKFLSLAGLPAAGRHETQET